MTKGPYSATIAIRLAARLVRARNGCLEWTGAVGHAGYGRINRGRRGAGWSPTHRVAWELEHGPVPDGMGVLHRCDNPPCCEVSHLFLGSQQVNTQDMMSKDRGRGQLPSGASHPDAKLTDAQVSAMRALYPELENYAELGRRFGVSKQYARTIVLGRARAPQSPLRL